MITVRRALSAVLALVVVGTFLPLVVHAPPARAQAASVVINEFLAVNETTLQDNTGQFEDWIELRNTSGSRVDLSGWTIADGSEAFTFPAGTSIAANAYRVLWASGDTTRTNGADIHLPFKLSSSGEALTLTDASGQLSNPSWPAPSAFPVQLVDDSYGIASGGQLRYFTDPTPGAANRAGQSGLVQPVSFSVEHGFYNSTQTIVLSSPTAGASIRYTTNGDEPSASVGTVLSSGSSITVSETTTIRAVAYRDGWITSPIETRSYLFTADIINQGRPEGWPAGPIVGDLTGRGQVLDYGMDPNVVAGNESTIRASLVGIPTISIVTDLENLFDPATGIYVNPEGRGEEWERPASVELIDPSGAEPGFDIEAGIRIRGGFSRRWTNPKHALRLFFSDDYESQLDYPLFGSEGTDRFEKVDLRTSSNYAWSWRHRTEASFIGELWSRDTQGAMGQPYTRTRQYHVYLNGTYWGLFMTQERVSGEYGESYFGGDEDDYDVVKRSAPGWEMEATAGTDTDWKSLFPLVSDLNVTDAEFAQLDSEVDLVNLADYYLLHFFSGDADASPTSFRNNNWSNNWYALRNRNRVGAAAKWQFFDHDSEHSLCLRYDVDGDNTTPWNLDPSDGDQFMTPAYLHEALITHPAYRQIFVDRVALHMLTPGGALTVPEAQARLDFRAQEVSPAVDAESARWGDGGGEPAYGRSEWVGGVQGRRDCLAARMPVVEAQLRADGLWPAEDPPTISPNGGAVPYGTNVSVTTTDAGTIYYTTNGDDPRAADGSVAGAARAGSGPISITNSLTVKARVRAGGQWSPLAEAAFVLSSPAGPVSVAVNEFNAVSSSQYLGGGTVADTGNGSDATLGRVLGNGGDWFELVVIEDDVDLRGWTFEVWNTADGVTERSAALTLTNNGLLANLRAGTLITISEDIADDVSYNPAQGDWHINLQANSSDSGAYVTAGSQTNFAIDNDDTQIAIFDASGVPIQLRTGEGTVPNVSVNSTEVFKLEATPTIDLTPASNYADGSTSTWGLPNAWSGGAETQDFSGMRILFGDVTCDGRINLADALALAQYSVGGRDDAGECPLGNLAYELNAEAGDVDGDGRTNLADALRVAQCSVGQANDFCP